MDMLRRLEEQMQAMSTRIDEMAEAFEARRVDDEVEALAAERIRSGATERTEDGVQALADLGIHVRQQ